MLGLLASAGLRVGEAIRLQVDQVKLDLQPSQLHIRETKFHKSRIVPLHSTTTERLRAYQAQRAHLHYDGLSDAFFVSEQGHHLQYLALHNWFARLCQRLAIAPTAGGRAPCLMSFRHTFAVTCLQRWYQQGLDVQAWLPLLSVYSAGMSTLTKLLVPHSGLELLGAAGQRFQAYAYAGGDSDA